MEGSTEFKKKWRELRDSIQVPAKDAAKAHFRNKYRSWDACSKALNEAGIVSHFKTVNDVEQAGVEWWVEIGDEEILVNTCMVDKLKRDPQAIGGCYTYAMRYCVTTYLGWGEPDDDGNQAMGIEPAPQAASAFDMSPAPQAPTKTIRAEVVTPNKSAEELGMTAEHRSKLLCMIISGLETKEGWTAFYADNHAEMSLLQAEDQAAWQTVVDVYQERKKVIIENIKLKEQ